MSLYYIPVGYTNKRVDDLIGDIVKVTVDRPLGSFHPEHKDMYYPVNYGYIKGIIAPDGEEQDAYIIGEESPVEEFTGKVIAIIHRRDDVEEKWGLWMNKNGLDEEIDYNKREEIEKSYDEFEKGIKQDYFRASFINLLNPFNYFSFSDYSSAKSSDNNSCFLRVI